MKRTPHSLLFAFASLLLASGCNSSAQPTAGQPAPAKTVDAATTAAKAPLLIPPAPSTQQQAEPTVRGKVVETMDAAGYTYVRVQPASGDAVWAAGPQTPVKVGDEVIVATSMPMNEYHSTTLNRTFDVVYFAGEIAVVGAQGSREAQFTQAHGRAAAAPAQAIDLAGIEKAPGGHTVAEVYAASADLSGKPVTIRGKVVKFTPRVMGKNWLHVRDGSGTGPTADITVTTADEVAVGDLVLLTGTLAVNQDFGSGYSYPVLVQDAKLEVQAPKAP